MSAARATSSWPSVYEGSMADMRSWSCPRGAYQSSRPRIRTSVPSAMRTPPPARVRARFTGRLLRDDSITPRHAPPSAPGSVSVK